MRRILPPSFLVATLCAWLLNSQAIAADVFKLASATNNNGGAEMSNASGEGFTLSYKTPLQDDCRSIVELDTHGLQLAEGHAIEISFTLSTAQVTPGTMFGWGFDFGNTVVLSILTTGTPKYTFFQNRYDLEGGFPFTIGTLANAWSVQNNPDVVPSSDAAVTAGSSVKIVATLKRLE